MTTIIFIFPTSWTYDQAAHWLELRDYLVFSCDISFKKWVIYAQYYGPAF